MTTTGASGHGKAEGKKARTIVQPAGDTHAGDTPAWWFDARGVERSHTALERAVAESSCTAVLTSITEQNALDTSKPRICFVESLADLEKLEPGVGVLGATEEIAHKARAAGRSTGVYVHVADMETEFTRCLELAAAGFDHLVIDIPDATYIPYEQLLVRTRSSPTKILRSIPIRGLEGTVAYTNQSLNAFATMEHGIGVLYRMQRAEDIRQLTDQLDRRRPGLLSLLAAEVVSVTHCGLGHRACIDTTTMMTAEEGMIIGSTGWGGIFVCSETHYLPHMNLREFRVNAGGVHSYVWGPGNTHYYLSEMKAGREVVVVDTKGHSRVATVGRAKIERRPLLLIEARVTLDKVPEDVQAAVERARRAGEIVTPAGEKIDRDGKYVFVNAFLQNDWHVRVMGADGKVRHSTLVKPGEELMAHVDKPGRHMGEAIEEAIIEK